MTWQNARQYMLKKEKKIEKKIVSNSFYTSYGYFMALSKTDFNKADV